MVSILQKGFSQYLKKTVKTYIYFDHINRQTYKPIQLVDVSDFRSVDGDFRVNNDLAYTAWRESLDSGSIFPFAGPDLVCGHEKLLL